eukprot:840044_1
MPENPAQDRRSHSLACSSGTNPTLQQQTAHRSPCSITQWEFASPSSWQSTRSDPRPQKSSSPLSFTSGLDPSPHLSSSGKRAELEVRRLWPKQGDDKRDVAMRK